MHIVEYGVYIGNFDKTSNHENRKKSDENRRFDSMQKLNIVVFLIIKIV